MATGPRYKVPFRRRREGRTDYHQRKRLLRGRELRAVVRKSLRHTSIQLVDFTLEGDKVLVSAHSKELTNMGWQFSTSNLPSAYLTGYMAGKRAMAKGIESAVLDIGLNVPVKGSTCFAALQGMVDAGLYIPHGDDVMPSEERVKGHHISDDIESAMDDIIGKLEAD
jgi:large subunit ribosomal protein L18